MITNFPPSPITGTSNVRILDEFAAQDIIDLYAAQENIDVSDFFPEESVYIVECLDSRYRFYYPCLAGEGGFYMKLQAAQERRGLEYDRDVSDDHRFAFEHIETGEKVLEIGCGSGKFLEEVKKKAGEVTGLDFNIIIAEQAREKGLNIVGESIIFHATRNAEKYDVVCAFQVLEHIYDVREILTAMVKVLKPSGKLIVSVPNNEPYFLRFGKYEVLNMPPHHVGLWNLRALKSAGEILNLKLVNHKMTAFGDFTGTSYLRAKLMAGVKSLPRRHTFLEKLKIFACLPFAVAANLMDAVSSERPGAHLSVVFQKLE